MKDVVIVADVIGGEDMQRNIHRKRNPDFWSAKGRIPLWLIAEELSIHEQTLMRWLRVEVEPEKMGRILEAIEVIKQAN